MKRGGGVGGDGCSCGTGSTSDEKYDAVALVDVGAATLSSVNVDGSKGVAVSFVVTTAAVASIISLVVSCTGCSTQSSASSVTASDVVAEILLLLVVVKPRGLLRTGTCRCCCTEGLLALPLPLLLLVLEVEKLADDETIGIVCGSSGSCSSSGTTTSFVVLISLLSIRRRQRAG